MAIIILGIIIIKFQKKITILLLKVPTVILRRNLAIEAIIQDLLEIICKHFRAKIKGLLEQHRVVIGEATKCYLNNTKKKMKALISLRWASSR